MHLSRFPRVRLGHMPTPLEPMDNLSRLLGGPRLWIKRDDCTGLSTGGNKTRKLEFLMADALEKGADTIITQGATQSNHARQTVAAACKLGLGCHILLEDRTGSHDPAYNYNGNVFLDQLHGATVEKRPGGADMAAEMEALAETLKAEGKTPTSFPAAAPTRSARWATSTLPWSCSPRPTTWACRSTTWCTPPAVPAPRLA